MVSAEYIELGKKIRQSYTVFFFLIFFYTWISSWEVRSFVLLRTYGCVVQQSLNKNINFVLYCFCKNYQHWCCPNSNCCCLIGVVIIVAVGGGIGGIIAGGASGGTSGSDIIAGGGICGGTGGGIIAVGGIGGINGGIIAINVHKVCQQIL